MSKKKMTIEDLLEEAVVRDEEQPYEVPKNWRWSKLDTLLDKIQYGYTEKATLEPVGPHFLRITDLKDNIDWGKVPYCAISNENLNKYKLNHNDIVIARMGSVGKCQIIKEPELSVFASYLIRIKTNSAIISDYLALFMKSRIYWHQITTNSKGTTRANINSQGLKNLIVPIAPLPEQKRIAKKVERLLSKIEEAKQLIEEAKETFKLRRAAILDKAFRGELTGKWREENNSEDILNYITSLKTITNLKENGDILEPYVLPSGWRWARIGDLFHVQVGSTPSRKNADYWEGRLPWLSSGEVQFNTINESREHVTDLAVKERRLKLAPKGSILFGMIGEGKTRGQVALLNLDAFHNQNIASIWVSNTKISSLYVYYWLVSQYSKNRQNSAGNNQPAYNKSRVQELLIPIAPIAEIEVIVNQLRKLLESEINVKNLLSLGETLTDIKQSILSKAFKGELGTNAPSEENAIELLKEVLQGQVK